MNRFAVALLQRAADLPERRQRDPAGPRGAGTGDTVTLALQLCPLLQDLLRELKKKQLFEESVSSCELTFPLILQLPATCQLCVKNLWKNNLFPSNRSL